VGAERFNQCDEYAKKLINSDNPYQDDIEKRQEQLRFVQIDAHILSLFLSLFYSLLYSIQN
jgi:hypothetical protein